MVQATAKKNSEYCIVTQYKRVHVRYKVRAKETQTRLALSFNTKLIINIDQRENLYLMPIQIVQIFVPHPAIHL